MRSLCERDRERGRDMGERVRHGRGQHFRAEPERVERAGGPDAGEPVHRRPDEQGVAIERVAFEPHAPLGGGPGESLTQQREGVPRLAHHRRVLRGIGQGGTEHQPVLQRVRGRVGEIGPPERGEILLRGRAARARIEMRAELREGAGHDLGEDVVAALVMLVGRLMRHAEPARDLAQAQGLDALPLDDLERRAHASLTQVSSLGLGSGSRHAGASSSPPSPGP